MRTNPSRRSFLRSAPLAAAAATLPAAASAQAQVTPATAEHFKLFTADKIADSMKKLHAPPGNAHRFDSPALPLAVVLTTEDKKSAKEFEWHEGRDHVVHILEGTTVYEVGGLPENPRSTKPGEWLAASAQGASTLTLHKGDMLIIPRGTLHKRSTETNVTFFLISTPGTVPSHGGLMPA